MIVTKQELAKKILSYLQGKLSLAGLVDWAENVMMEGDFQGDEPELVQEMVARLGVADVKTFGLFWEDCSTMMKKLGFQLHIDAGLVA